MAWTTPMTAVANGTAWTAAQWNTHVRDNLNETTPGKATATAGGWFVSTAANAIAERTISAATVLTNETRTLTSYGDLTTVGPSVTVTTGTSALVWINAQCFNSTSNAGCWFSFTVSGASSVAASDTWAGLTDGVTLNDVNRFGVPHLITGLTAGSNTFKMQYKVDAGTGNFQRREIVVIPL
jgi:hypothetical protein